MKLLGSTARETTAVLPPGDYVLDVRDRVRRHLRMSPKRFAIAFKQTARVDVEIDTGIVDNRSQPSLDSGTRIFPTVEARNHYDASADGERFLVNSRRPEDAGLSITVVTGRVFERKK